MRSIRQRLALCLLPLAFVAMSVAAEEPASTPAAAQAAPAPPKLNPERGPKDISLGEQGTLKLPAGFVYLNPSDAAAMLSYWGNPGANTTLGMVLGEDDKDSWAITLKFHKEGYVKDEEAKTWDADELFKSVKEGTEASNEERKKMGGGELHIIDWVQKPQYEASTHRLVWGMRAEGVDGGVKSESVNYRTYVLGREGFIEMNLMTDPEGLDASKPRANELLAATAFNDGKRYEDFDAKTDHIAEYGLAALVAGGVAKKLGLLATLGLLLAKFWKVALIGLAVFGGGIAKLLKRKSS